MRQKVFKSEGRRQAARLALLSCSMVTLAFGSAAIDQQHSGLMKSGPDDPILVKALGKLTMRNDDHYPFTVAISMQITTGPAKTACNARVSFNPYLDPGSQWSLAGDTTGACANVFSDLLKTWTSLPKGEYAVTGIDPNASIYDCEKRASDPGRSRFNCAIRLPSSYPDNAAWPSGHSTHTIIIDNGSGEMRTIISRLDQAANRGNGHRLEALTDTIDLAHFSDGAVRVVKSQGVQSGTQSGVAYKIETTTAYAYPTMSLDDGGR